MDIRVKRIYGPADEDDGFRVFVDRLWPRGLKKADARIDLWLREIAPTTELRKWFGHDPDRFDEFRSRYLDELKSHSDAIQQLIATVDGRNLTLLYAARDTECNHAIVLRDVISGERESDFASG